MATKNKANKGEWSEFYAFAKILSDGKLFAADSHLNKIEEKTFTVLNVSRKELKEKRKIYDPHTDPDIVSIFSEGALLKIVKKENLKESVKKIFNEIKSAKTSSFESASASILMDQLLCGKIKSGSNKKEDINILIEDRIASVNTELGFSIKSRLGGLPTLFNASLHTNFIFSVKGMKSGVDDEINNIQGASKIKKRIQAIENFGGTLSFFGVESAILEENLKFIDSNFPAILGEMILAFYQGKAKNISALIDYMDESGILTEKLNINKVRTIHKVKDFLVDIALGMTPAHPWAGETLAHGGYIVVREDGDVVCYHLYNRDEFKDYLYNNTLFDTPSTTRHHFAKLYQHQNGKKCIKLNLQIRFKK